MALSGLVDSASFTAEQFCPVLLFADAGASIRKPPLFARHLILDLQIGKPHTPRNLLSWYHAYPVPEQKGYRTREKLNYLQV